MNSLYKAGDKVTIIEREGSSGDYPLFFAKEMCVYSGKVVTIEKVEPITYSCKGYKFYNGDDFRYHIKEDGGAYHWHSSMFKNVKSLYNVGDKVTIVEREGSELDYPFTFTKSMNELAGKTFIINSVTPVVINHSLKYYNGDDYEYRLEGLTWQWHSSMFKKAENTIQKVNNLQNTKNHENRFQKPKASFRRGSVPKGRTVCGRTNEARVTVKHLSNKPVYC